MATYTRTRRPDNRVVDTCTWCGVASGVTTEQASERRFQREHQCQPKSAKFRRLIREETPDV